MEQGETLLYSCQGQIKLHVQALLRLDPLSHESSSTLPHTSRVLNVQYLGLKTIEGELLEAFHKAGHIDPEWLDNPQKAFFQRASRL